MLGGLSGKSGDAEVISRGDLAVRSGRDCSQRRDARPAMEGGEATLRNDSCGDDHDRNSVGGRSCPEDYEAGLGPDASDGLAQVSGRL